MAKVACMHFRRQRCDNASCHCFSKKGLCHPTTMNGTYWLLKPETPKLGIWVFMKLKFIQEIWLLKSFWDRKRLLEVCCSLGYRYNLSRNMCTDVTQPDWRADLSCTWHRMTPGCFLEYSSYLVGICLSHTLIKWMSTQMDIIFNSIRDLSISTLINGTVTICLLPQHHAIRNISATEKFRNQKIWLRYEHAILPGA